MLLAITLDKSETPNNLNGTNGKTNGSSGKPNGVTTPQSTNGFRQMKCLETSNNDEQTSIIKRWDLFFHFLASLLLVIGGKIGFMK